ncbi:methyltransferase domain-containing protein [Winogradskyella sp. 3972H.M.0a.05]|uniref:class I SAM-dependent methyltransferase n=1 Tax=Winogradskyella sp. 3972H.M.0a.05 TaxID=2950277 RepID=UPI003392515B
MKATFEDIYHNNEQSHFWFKARRKLILQFLKSYQKDIKILDVGCSSGILLKELIEEGFDPKLLYGIDISEKAINNCKSNGLKNVFVMDAQNITLKEKFDVIIASDCLEHLQEDEKALIDWENLMHDNGTLMVFVPALKVLWSKHDELNMHYRRYTRKELSQKIKQTGLRIEKASYWNTFLFLPIYFIRVAGRVINKKSKDDSGDIKPIPLINSILYLLLLMENKLLRFMNFFIGVSTFSIAKKQSK